MKVTKLTVTVLAAGLATAASAWAGCGACGAAHGSKAKAEEKAAHAHADHKHDLVETAIEAGSFKTLVAAIKAAELVDVLKGDGPFTVFAPTDEAFAKLPEGTIDELLLPENRAKLAAILTYHVVPGKVMASDVVALDEAVTVQGEKVTITTDEGQVRVDGANVVKTDIETSNGIIHVIDAVILPGKKS